MKEESTMNHSEEMAGNGNFKKFMLLWAGEFISSVGGGLTAFGLGVYVFAQTGSAAGMALVTLISFLPTILLAIPAGVLADRFDRRLLMMIGDGCSGLGILYILICMCSGGASLWQICLGMGISSVFASLLEPSYRATITDLLTKEEFSKANGLVSLAGSSRYLLSPIIAGFLLAISDVKLLLVIDIATFFLTVTAAAVVRKGLERKEIEDKAPFFKSMKEGWQAVCAKEGLILLIMVSSLITLFMGMFQILAEPFVLSFADSKTLGIVETVCASGMLVSGVFLGIRGIKKGYAKVLGGSLALAGVFMILFGWTTMIVPIAIFGFLFFLVLPFANNSLDYLVRTNIPDELQGRAWGFIGFLSQLGYVVAYGFGGLIADGLGAVTGGGVGRGAAITIQISGCCMAIVSIGIFMIKKIRRLEA